MAKVNYTIIKSKFIAIECSLFFLGGDESRDKVSPLQLCCHWGLTRVSKTRSVHGAKTNTFHTLSCVHSLHTAQSISRFELMTFHEKKLMHFFWFGDSLSEINCAEKWLKIQLCRKNGGRTGNVSKTTTVAGEDVPKKVFSNNKILRFIRKTEKKHDFRLGKYQRYGGIGFASIPYYCNIKNKRNANFIRSKSKNITENHTRHRILWIISTNSFNLQ